MKPIDLEQQRSQAMKDNYISGAGALNSTLERESLLKE